MAEALDLGAALDTVVATLAAAFPTFKTVAAEDETRKTLEVPAIIVQMSELEPDPDKDPHTGQFPCLVRIEARIVLGYRTPKVRREVLKAAGALAAAVHSNRLGVAWARPQSWLLSRMSLRRKRTSTTFGASSGPMRRISARASLSMTA